MTFKQYIAESTKQHNFKDVDINISRVTQMCELVNVAIMQDSSIEDAFTRGTSGSLKQHYIATATFNSARTIMKSNEIAPGTKDFTISDQHTCYEALEQLMSTHEFKTNIAKCEDAQAINDLLTKIKEQYTFESDIFGDDFLTGML